MVIFGAAGDLTRRKLIPALYNLAKAQLLSREFAIVGVAHSPDVHRGFPKQAVGGHQAICDRRRRPDTLGVVRRSASITSPRNFDDKALYPQLKELLEKVDKDHSTHGNYFFYLATAPTYFGPIVEQLGRQRT